MANNISRRDILKNLAVGISAGPAMQTLSVEAAEHVHQSLKLERGQAAGGYTPKFFNPHAYETLKSLCQSIIPPDKEVGGAVEAGAPEFIDLLTSENQEYQLTLGGGIAWLDSTCDDRFGKPYLECSAAQQKEILDLIAYRKNAVADPALMPGVKFFAFLRELTTDGFFTSEIGIKYLEYIGNTYLAEFPGCPPVPES
jgi:gluconate 2-dehydrogenase gamma chain